MDASVVVDYTASRIPEEFSPSPQYKLPVCGQSQDGSVPLAMCK